MYDRILQILLESSAARRAKTRATIASAIAKNPDAANRLYNQKADPLAQRAAVAAKKAKVGRVQSQGQSQPGVSVAASRKDARKAGQELIGTTGRSGSKLPRVAPTATKPETDQRALVPSTTRALVPSTTRAVVPVRPEIQGQGNRKPIKFRDPGEQDAVVSPAKVPFNRTYRKVLGALKGARPIVGMKPKGLDMSPVTNAFNVGKDPERTIAGTQKQQTQDDKKANARNATVKNLLKGLTGRKSMRNRPSYNP